MPLYDAKQIRNVAVVGHGDAGKTTVVSALLYAGGSNNRLGNVNDGTAVTDFDPDEIERQITISTSIAHVNRKKDKLNLIDTPGYGVFVADARAGLRVADCALFVVCGVSGVEVQTERTLTWADELQLPRILVVNKLDRERASFDRALESITETFGRGAVPIMLPFGSEKDFCGLLDLVLGKLYRYAGDGSNGFETEEVPTEMQETVAAARSKLVELVAEQDDALMEQYFEQGDLTDQQVTDGLRKAVLTRGVIPVLPFAAARNIGSAQLLDVLTRLAPTVDRISQVAGSIPDSGEATRDILTGGPSAFVFKTIADPYAGRISLFRVMTGTLKSDANMYNAAREKGERYGSLFFLQGKEQENVPEIPAGDLGGVAKLKETKTGDTLSEKSDPIVYPPIAFPNPSISFAIEPKSKQDEEKISIALRRLTEEDPTLSIGRDPQTNELLVSGTGQLHVEVTLAKAKKRYGVEALLRPPKVPYLETIRGKAEVQGKHKKQTGGHGQYGDCWIRMEPLPRGGDFVFASEIFGGSIPRNFIPAIEKGIQEQRKKGVLAGCPVVDFKVTVFDGSYHTVDSSEMAFKMAASKAFKKAVMECKPALLEPIMKVSISTPDDFVGDLMGDLSSRRGRVQGTIPKNGRTSITAEVPMAEMLTYASTLKSLTQDRANFEMEQIGYSEVPAHITEKIIAEAKAARGEEAED